MYSGLDDALLRGVPGDDSFGGYSKADLKEISDMAVSGTSVGTALGFLDVFRRTLMTDSLLAVVLVKGFTTSLATLTTTSNWDASCTVGSKYK